MERPFILTGSLKPELVGSFDFTEKKIPFSLGKKKKGREDLLCISAREKRP